MAHRKAAHCQRGFTLMELVITLVLMGILGTYGASLITDNFRTARMVNATQTSADHVRYAVERMAREIREIKFVDKATGYGIASMSATNLVFTRVIGGADVTVTITLTGTDVTLRYSPAAASILSSQVSGFTLAYLKLDNTAATLATDVRFVVITLTATDATSGQAITERTRVALRNA